MVLWVVTQSTPNFKCAKEFLPYRDVISATAYGINSAVNINRAAVTATRYNPTLKAFYQKLIQNGKPAKVAITAVMRKLAILLNSIARNTLYTNNENSAIIA